MDIIFEGKSFCFTGKMAGLNRIKAESEARARGGMTSDAINKNLDYLIVGSIPANGWKFGNYGRKIEKARELIKNKKNRYLRIIPEETYTDSLARTPSDRSGDIESKVVVWKYSFKLPYDEVYTKDIIEANECLDILHKNLMCHITTSEYDLAVYNDLYGNEKTEYSKVNVNNPGDYRYFECKLIKEMLIKESNIEISEMISKSFGNIKNIDGELTSFEAIEGSANFIRLIKESEETRINV